MSDETDPLSARRRRLLWRATHRGIKEMDVLLGGFARANIETMESMSLNELEAIIAIPDQELFAWIIGEETVPAENRSPTLSALIAYKP